MKVLLASHFFPPGHIGGTEVLTLSLAKGLIGLGCEVEVICNEGWDSAQHQGLIVTNEVYDGVPVCRLHFNWQKAPDIFLYLYNNPEVYQFFKEYMMAHKPDILHVTSCYSLSASMISAAYDLGIKVLLTATDFWFVCAKNTLMKGNGDLCPGQESAYECTRCLAGEQKFFKLTSRMLPRSLHRNLIESLGKRSFISNLPGFRGLYGDWETRFRFMESSLEKVSRIITASNLLRDLFIRYGVPGEKIYHSSYGLDTSWAENFQEKEPSSELRIGFIGQISPAKGPDLLIRAVASLSRSSPLKVKIYGDLSKDREYGRQLVELAGSDARVSFMGTFENSKMGEVLAGIDVLAVPSVWYDFPLVIPSAFATRTPVIATNLPGMNELVTHGVNGLLFERYNWSDLASIIQGLLEKPEMIHQLRQGIKSPKTVGEMCREYLMFYRALLEA